MPTKVEDVANSILVGFFVGLLLGLVVSSVAVVKLTSSAWMRESVERGYAHYNTQIGCWQWNNDPAAAREAGDVEGR